MGRVLVADDDPAVRRTLAAALDSAGHTVVQAADGPGALALLQADSLDLLITDLNMPGFGGLELLGRRPRSIPAIVVSGSWTDEEKRAARELGAARIFEKGTLDPAELVAEVGALLGV